MTVVYPLSLPETATPIQVQISHMPIVGTSVSPFTFETQIQEAMGEVLIADIGLPLMDREEAAEVYAMFLALKGRKGTLLLGDPNATTPQGTALGDPSLNAAHAAGAEILTTDGWTASQTEALKIGDWIQVGQRLHMVIYEDVETDGSGEASIHICPALKTAMPDNTPVITADCKGLFRLRENLNRAFTLSRIGLYEMSIQMIEAF